MNNTLNKKQAVKLWSQIEALRAQSDRATTAGQDLEDSPLFDVKLRAVHNPHGNMERWFGVVVYPIPRERTPVSFVRWEDRLHRLFQEVLLTDEWKRFTVSMVSKKEGLAYLWIGA